MDSALQPTSFELRIKRQPPRTPLRHDFIFSIFFLLRLNDGGRREGKREGRQEGRRAGGLAALVMDGGDLGQ